MLRGRRETLRLRSAERKCMYGSDMIKRSTEGFELYNLLIHDYAQELDL